MRIAAFLSAKFGRDTLLRRLALLYLAGIVAVMLGAAAVVAFAVWPHFEALEKRETEHRLQAVLQAVQSERDRLQELLSTNATWDDAFDYVLTRDPAFTGRNFSPDALGQIDVDAVLVLDNAGARLFGGAGDDAALLDAVAEAVRAAPGLQLAGRDHQNALIALGREAVIVSAQRIVRTDGSGASPGVLVFARRMQPDIVARMRSLTGTPFNIYMAAADAPTGDVRGATDISDAYGRSAIHVVVQGRHDVLAVGQSTIQTLAIAVGVMLSILAALFAAALHHAVIAPVSALRRAVRASSKTGAPFAAPSGAPTEISVLAASFDFALQAAQRQSEVSHAALAAKQLAEAANVAKSQFIAQISHELRTPLNAIIGYSEIMAESAEDEARKQDVEDAQRIRRAAQSLLALINAILDFSKLGAGKMQAAPEEFEVATMLKAVQEITAPLAASKGLELSLIVEDGLGLMYSDPQKLKQCLINLLSNAVKFTQAGGVGLRATRAIKDGATHIQFEVSDSGIGIEPEALKRIFEPFAQADKTIAGRYGGTGLGLAITRDLVRLLGGRIGVRSKPGAGTTFVMRMPIVLPGAQQELRAAA